MPADAAETLSTRWRTPGLRPVPHRAGALGGVGGNRLEQVFPVFPLQAVDDRFDVLGGVLSGY